jgi:hypothetical protein
MWYNNVFFKAHLEGDNILGLGGFAQCSKGIDIFHIIGKKKVFVLGHILFLQWNACTGKI